MELVCQCPCRIMFDYVSRCVYINEIEIFFSVCVAVPTHVCGYVSAYVYLCVCAYMMEEEKRWRVEN